MQYGIKHLIECSCMLPQMKSKGILHKFLVFSIVDEEKVQVKFAQCNNCGVIHKVTEICKSTILNGKENLKSILTIDDIKASISPNLAFILEKAECELSLWEHAKFIIDNKRWGEFVILSKSIEDGFQIIKYVQIIGENLFKIETNTKEIL
jgi:hypothetical protein